MKTQTNTVQSFGMLGDIEGDNMRVRIDFTTTDLSRIIEEYIALVKGNKKQESTAQSFLELIRKRPALFSIMVPLPVAHGYDMGKGRYSTFKGKRYYTEEEVIPASALELPADSEK